jgi:hypothetical protein
VVGEPGAQARGAAQGGNSARRGWLKEKGKERKGRKKGKEKGKEKEGRKRRERRKRKEEKKMGIGKEKEKK